MVVVCHYCEEVYPDDVDSLNKKCDKCGNFIQPIERRRAQSKEWWRRNQRYKRFYDKSLKGENVQKLIKKGRL